jgi:outer membrane protein assembly factor BamB
VSGRVAAVDLASGKELWRNELAGAGTGPVDLHIDGGEVLACVSTSDALFCLDYATGELRWQAETRGYGRASILVDGPHVIVARNGYVTCLSRKGERLWVNALNGLGLGPTAVGLPGNVRQADSEGNR